MGTVPFTVVKRPGRGVDHPPTSVAEVNPLNTKLNPTCHLLALLGAHHILNVSRIRVKEKVELYSYSPFAPPWQVTGPALRLLQDSLLLFTFGFNCLTA